jgi:hypothetical protein
MIFNAIKSDESYVHEKYFKWYKSCFQSPQNNDPTLLPCSFCGRRTPKLKLIHQTNRYYLVCKYEIQYKGDEYETQ